GGSQPEKNILACQWSDAPEDTPQDGGAYFGAATAATHGAVVFVERTVWIVRSRFCPSGARGVHGRQDLVAAHPTAVDPILDGPDPLAFAGERAAGGDGILVASANEAQELSLRGKRLQRLIGHRPAQVLGQRPSLADGEHARLRSRIIQHGGGVAGCEDERMRG